MTMDEAYNLVGMACYLSEDKRTRLAWLEIRAYMERREKYLHELKTEFEAMKEGK